MAPVHFGVLVIPFQIIDIAGPVDILGSASQEILTGAQALGVPAHLAKQGIDVEFHYIGETMKPVQASANIHITPTTTYQTCPKLDYLLIGGPDPTMFFKNVSPDMVKFIQARVEEVKTLFTTCSGAMVAAAAGVLDGIHATTNHGAIPLARQLFPHVHWTNEKQWVVDKDGKIWTSGGACAGMDMFAHWITERCGQEVAEFAFSGLDFEPRDVVGNLVPLSMYGHIKASE